MITPVDDILEGVEEFRDKIFEIIVEEIEPFEPEIIDHIIDEQLFTGQDSAGREIRPAYTPFTVSIKRQIGQPVDRVTLKDKGDFYDSMEIKFSRDRFEIINTDSKAKSLQKKYGEDILGLDDNGRQLVIDLIREPMVKRFKQDVLG